MTFDDILAQIIDLLKRQGRVSYSALKRRFDLDDDYLNDLKDELLYVHPVRDDEGRGLVWVGEQAVASAPPPVPETPARASAPAPDPAREPLSYTPKHLAEKILTSRSALEGERKQVTVLFCDLANSTPIAERIGPEAMHTLLNRFFEVALTEVHRYEGTINQFLGDGFMALFGAPLAHEDHARRGVLAALALQRTLKEADLGKPYGEECTFRMGLNSGLVVVGSIGDNLRMDYSAVGDTTNLASRLQQQAEPGDILSSESTSRLVQGAVRLEAFPPVQIKGKTEPVPIYKVRGTLPRRSPMVSRGERTLSPFVGREREVATLEALFAQVEAGQGQVVGVVAEAGGGKSRLLYEFRQRLQDKRVTYLEGRCLSYGSTTPYHPLIDVLRHHCGILETDSPEVLIGKVHHGLDELGMDVEGHAPYLLRLLGVERGTEHLATLSPEALRHHTFDTLQQMSLKGSQQRPLIFELEDLHWIDQSSEEYLTFLVESLAGAPMLLLTSYRPGYQPLWLAKSYATQVSLQSLAPHDAVTVVHATSQQRALPEPLAQTIIDKAQGNPFFLEELTHAVIDQGALQESVIVPDTIQGVLMARIDRLPEAHKRLLQTAAVLGREFSPRVLEAMWDGTGALEPVLLDLKRLEFLFERTGGDEPLLLFKHALTQEVAYESVLTTRRQVLHAAAGQALEQLYADRLADAYDRLAYHYARTDHPRKAIDYLLRSAEHAARHYAHTEAVTALQHALLQVERLPAAEQDRPLLALLLRLASSLHFLGRFPEGLKSLLQHRDRVDRVHDLRLTGPYDFWLGNMYSYLGNQTQAIHYAQHALECARRCDDLVTLGKAYYLLARDDGYWSGHFLRGIAHSRNAIAALEQTDERWWLGQSYWVLGLNHFFRGEFLPALEAEAQTQRIGEAIGDPRLQTYAAWATGVVYSFMGEYDQGIAACQRSLHHSPDPLNTVLASAFLGYTYLQQGHPAQARPLLEQATQHMAQFHFQQLYGWYLAWLGDAYLQEGHPETARDLASQSLTITREAKFWSGVGEAQRTLGRIAQTSGKLVEAAGLLQEALDTFSAIHSQFELARTHLDLASLAHDQGNQDTTITHLSTAHAWFKNLQVPKWVERSEQLAREYGITLKEVTLEGSTEESS
jgi:class 3 adenylate cyclase/tetratricopeptide (TPR) repeat protein